MKLIGVTGKSGSGKSTFASNLAKKLNCEHIDADKVAHQAYFQPEIKEVLFQKFGTEISGQNGEIDRKRLGNIVFSQEEKMEELLGVIWGYMKSVIDEKLTNGNGQLILEGITLPNCEYWKKCAFKVLVTSDNERRKQKVLERDHISEEYFNKRDSASIDYSPFKFDYIFKNDYKEETMRKKIEEIERTIGGEER